ncbi:MAG: hypothetical protein R2856_35185 [Caldilineaceae bacterium]
MTNPTNASVPLPEDRTDIYKLTRYGESRVGCVDADGVIYTIIRQRSAQRIGRARRTATVTASSATPATTKKRWAMSTPMAASSAMVSSKAASWAGSIPTAWWCRVD